MIRKYHNRKPQTTLWHREEEQLNHHETPGRQIKQSNQLSLPHAEILNINSLTSLPNTFSHILFLNALSICVEQVYTPVKAELTVKSMQWLGPMQNLLQLF